MYRFRHLLRGAPALLFQTMEADISALKWFGGRAATPRFGALPATKPLHPCSRTHLLCTLDRVHCVLAFLAFPSRPSYPPPLLASRSGPAEDTEGGPAFGPPGAGAPTTRPVLAFPRTFIPCCSILRRLSIAIMICFRVSDFAFGPTNVSRRMWPRPITDKGI